jgi:hypothetical protein
MRSRALQPPYVEAAFDVQHLASRVIKKSVQKMEQKGRSEFFGSSAQEGGSTRVGNLHVTAPLEESKKTPL